MAPSMKRPAAAVPAAPDTRAPIRKRPAAAPAAAHPDNGKKSRVASSPLSTPWLDDMLQNMQPDMKHKLVSKLQRLQVCGHEQRAVSFRSLQSPRRIPLLGVRHGDNPATVFDQRLTIYVLMGHDVVLRSVGLLPPFTRNWTKCNNLRSSF